MAKALFCGMGLIQMETTLNIRHAEASDLGKLLDLYGHLNSDDLRCPTEMAPDVFESFTQYKGSAILLGEVGDVLVSSCTLVVIPNLTRGGAPYGLIENVVTHGAYRGRGYGKLLLAKASQIAWDNQCYKVMLMTSSKDPHILAFYESAEFEQTKTGFQKRRS
jgi:GNAT superfamily N-acetyltransferase